MLDIIWYLFLPATIAVILIPGQDLVYVMSQGLGRGDKAGLIAASGVALGLIGHTILAALGLGALLHASELAFTLLKYLGAAYLTYLGIQMLFRKDTALSIKQGPNISFGKIFIQGALTNLSNPKVTLFYFAFLPQFVQTDTSHMSLSLFILGTTYALLTLLIKCPIGYFAGRLSPFIQRHPIYLQIFQKISGLAFLGLGVKLVLEEH